MKKIVGIILLTIVSFFIIFILEESLRLKYKDNSLPLLIIDRTKYCVSCIKPNEEMEVEYFSLGYKVIIRYYLSPDSSDDNKIIRINKKDFLLFNRYRLWSWIS